MKTLSLFSILVLAGCGAGTAPTASRLPDSSRFVPNYVSALSAGRQWSNTHITVQVRSTPGRDLKPAFQAAKTAWEAQYGTLFTLTDGPSADITLEIVPTGSLGGETVGLTTVTFRGGDARIVSAMIQLDASLSDALQVDVLAHELGHALGLDGHSPNADDLMFPRAHLPLQITTRDRNTLLSIYEDLLPTGTRKKDDGSVVTTVVCRYPKP